ncbi:uncharacterized protein LOC106670869 [Cimex lectularius]|uniref:Uncharacterized protein n=1 Tax=Cimex lectularius TaxID=79782 RepID=A0A8I6S2L1_CIMLE|nr:uncharacterized protein LOC106670869 [Cimex lectularius]
MNCFDYFVPAFLITQWLVSSVHVYDWEAEQGHEDFGKLLFSIEKLLGLTNKTEAGTAKPLTFSEAKSYLKMYQEKLHATKEHQDFVERMNQKDYTDWIESLKKENDQLFHCVKSEDEILQSPYDEFVKRVGAGGGTWADLTKFYRHFMRSHATYKLQHLLVSRKESKNGPGLLRKFFDVVGVMLAIPSHLGKFRMADVPGPALESFQRRLHQSDQYGAYVKSLKEKNYTELIEVWSTADPELGACVQTTTQTLLDPYTTFDRQTKRKDRSIDWSDFIAFYKTFINCVIIVNMEEVRLDG